MGKPVIATDWGGPADYLDASCGMLVAPTSYESLVDGFAAAMRKTMDSPELAKSMGAAGRERAIRDFDWQRKIERVIGIYRLLAEEPGLPQEFKEEPVSAPAISQRNC